MNETYILTLSCPDRIGLVAAVANFLAENDGFILESHQYGDTSTENFFMRAMFVAGKNSPSREGFEEKFRPIAHQLQMRWELHLETYKPKVLIMASKLGHCLNAILNKTAMGNLNIDISCVVSNHPDLKVMVEWYKTPFYHLPVTPETRQQQEEQVMKLAEEHEVDFIVLARYMQILSHNFVTPYLGKIINIHHSFLPSFKGAKPYHQALERGVKLIGATAHYVTDDLDEGPIIEQEVMRVDHTCTAEELVTIGQDIENIALIRAVKWHAQHRIFLNGQKTVVFR